MTTTPIRDHFVVLCDTPAELQAALQHVIKEVRPSPMPQFRLSFDLPRKNTEAMRAFFEKKGPNSEAKQPQAAQKPRS